MVLNDANLLEIRERLWQISKMMQKLMKNVQKDAKTIEFVKNLLDGNKTMQK